MATVTKRKTRSKSVKNLPLTRHPRGYWVKKIRGKTHYFGRIADDPEGQAAAIKWADEKDDLLAGRIPRSKRDGITVGRLCYDFIKTKEQLVASGELTKRSLAEYQAAGQRIIDMFGTLRPVDDLRPEDFAKLRAGIAKQWGLHRLAKEIQLIRTIFKFAFEARLIDKPVEFGSGFRKPSKHALRKHRKAKQAKYGKRMFTAAQIKKLLDTSSTQFHAMILLGINAGFGNTDCATLPMTALDMSGGWIEFPRPKTGVDRRCPLWPETVEALKKAIAKRPDPKDPAHSGLVFITKSGGSWAKETSDNPVSKEMAKLLKQLGIHRPNLGFYALRHGFWTIGKTIDRDAAKFIMGHAENEIGATYDEERPSDDRLLVVSNNMRNWIWPKPKQVADFSRGII